MSTEINNNKNDQQVHLQFMSFFSDLGDLICEIAEDTAELGGNLIETAKKDIDEITDDPVKFTKDSVKEVGEIAVPAAIGAAIGKACGTKGWGTVAAAVAGVAVAEVGKEILNDCIEESVTPTYGSIVYCRLAGAVEHSGIYIGGNRIVHLNGDGHVISSTPDEFTERLGGLNPHSDIYVSCDELGAVGCVNIADRSEKFVGDSKRYDLVFSNCHSFTSSCLAEESTADSFMWELKMRAKSVLGATEWRKWDR